MNSWTPVFLLYVIASYLASSESSLQTPNENLSQPNLHCAFENGSICLWKEMSASSDLSWRVYNELKPSYSHSTGPAKDHTTGTGYFLSMRLPSDDLNGTALLASPPIVTSSETCLSFWYFMYGNSVGGLNVYKIGFGNIKQELFTIFGPQGNRWYRAVVNTGSGNFKLHIEATSVGKTSYGDIAIDDITFSYQACQEDESTLLKDQPSFNCDFEHGMCSWYFEDDDIMTWHTINVPSDSKDRNALPPRSNGTSYIETVVKRSRYSMQSTLRGPSISVDSREACLSFWYKINGTDSNTFSVKMFDHGRSYYYGGKTLFTSDFTSGVVWLKGLVTLPENDNFNVFFKVYTYGRSKGTFTLDDVRLTHGGPCNKDDRDLINCDFERDFCRWYMKSKKDEGDWLRTRDPTPTNSTGPSHDHTTGGGYYIFLDASEVQEANLYSPPFSVNSSGACLSFWYYMHGPDVYTLELNSEGKRYYYHPISWSLKGPQGDQWHQHNISLKSGYNTRLVFTAKRSYFPRGDIALDDISITFGAPCESDLKEEITTFLTISPEITRNETLTDSPVLAVTTPTTTTTTTTEPPPLEIPQLLVKGKIDPAYNNSRIELICHYEGKEEYWIRWYRRERNYYYNEKQLIGPMRMKNLLFQEIQPKDAAFYSCALQMRYDYDRFSNSSNEVQIKVVPDPRPSPLLEIEGENVYEGYPVDVEVDSVASLVCGHEINGGEYHWTTTSHAFTSFSLPKDRILVLNKTQPQHSGVYSCRISKDGFLTGKSNELKISVKAGKRCKSDWHCFGDNYYDDCQSNRCKCSRNAVIRGRECLKRPERPTLTTSPEFLEFGIGESFYLVCEAKEPAPANLTYTFSIRYQERESVSVMKISNATELNSGRHSCHVTYNDINSRDSELIYIKIQDFVNLNCDFDDGLCTWFQNNETDTADFALVSPMIDDDDAQNNGPSGPYIQLVASNITVPRRAVLISATISRMAKDSCLTFWYRMHGPDAHSLSLWRYTYSDKSKSYGGSKLWAVIGDKGDIWFKQNVTIGSGNNFYIAFDAIGQVAVDDVTFTYRGGC